MFLDKSGPATGPIRFTDISNDSVTISWDPPIDKGGSKVTHYIVSKRDTTRVSWSTIAEDLETCSFTAKSLIKGNEYQFSVRAVNECGAGEVLISNPITAKNMFGKIYFYSRDTKYQLTKE